MEYGAVLLYEYLKRRGDSPMRRYCMMVDVFPGMYATVPSATSRRLRDLEASCEEIAQRWPALYDKIAQAQTGGSPK